MGKLREGVAIDDIIPADYTFAAEFYLPQGDNSFKVDEEYYSYLTLNNPLGPIVETMFEFMIPESYKITLLENGNIEIEYSYHYYDEISAYSYTGDVSLLISDISSTKNRYTEDDLNPYVVPTSWKEYDNNLASSLDQFLTDSSLLPFPSNIEGIEDISSSLSSTVDIIFLNLSDNADGNKVLNDYLSLLKNHDWTVGEADATGEYACTYQTEDKTLNIGVWKQDTSITIFVYQPIDKPIDGGLASFIYETFSSSANCTYNANITKTTSLGSQSQTWLTEYTDTAMRQEIKENNNLIKDTIWTEEGSNFNTYVLENGQYVKKNTGYGSLTSNRYTFYDFASYGNEITVDGDGYKLSENASSYLINYIVTNDGESILDDGFTLNDVIKATFDQENKVIVFNGSASNDNGDIITFVITVSNIGTTIIDELNNL